MQISISVDEYRELRDFPTSPLPDELIEFFEIAKITMRLPSARCHFIDNQVAKDFTNGTLVRIGALGTAYVEDCSFAFVESDDGREWDKNTIIHEMLHLLGATHTADNYSLYEVEVKKFREATERNIAVCIEKRR